MKTIKQKTPMQSLRSVLNNFLTTINHTCISVDDYPKVSNKRPTHFISGRTETTEDFLRIYKLYDGCFIKIKFNFLNPKTNRTVEPEKQSIEFILCDSEEKLFNSLAYPIEEFREKLKSFYQNFNRGKLNEKNYIKSESQILIKELVEHFQLHCCIEENINSITSDTKNLLAVELENLVLIDNELAQLNQKLIDRKNIIYKLETESELAIEIAAMEEELKIKKLELKKQIQEKQLKLCITELHELINKSKDARFNIEDLIKETVYEFNKVYYLPKFAVEKVIKELEK